MNQLEKNAERRKVAAQILVGFATRKDTDVGKPNFWSVAAVKWANELCDELDHVERNELKDSKLVSRVLANTRLANER
jgi:hypothetical protein